MDSLRNDMSGLWRDVNTLRTEMNTRFDQLNRRFNTLYVVMAAGWVTIIGPIIGLALAG